MDRSVLFSFFTTGVFCFVNSVLTDANHKTPAIKTKPDNADASKPALRINNHPRQLRARAHTYLSSFSTVRRWCIAAPRPGGVHYVAGRAKGRPR